MEPVPSLSPNAFRALFPQLARGTYLASCSYGARSPQVDLAISRMQENSRGPGVPWAFFEEETAALRKRAGDFFRVAPTQLALLPNVSTAAFQVASTVALSSGRSRIVTTQVEFPSVSQVWLAQRGRGAEVVHVEAREGIDAQDYLDAIDERTALVSVPLNAYRDGSALPVRPVIERAHRFGARVFVDAYQGAGVQPINIEQLNCDFLATGTYKYLLGLPGLAFLYAREASASDLSPQLTGWFGRVDPFAFDPHDLSSPSEARRFESGTPCVPSIFAAHAALSLLSQLDLVGVQRHIAGLTALATARLLGQGERVRSPEAPERRGAQVTLADSDPLLLAKRLLERGVTVSPRGECIRLAFHYYNTEEDVRAACDALADVRAST